MRSTVWILTSETEPRVFSSQKSATDALYDLACQRGVKTSIGEILEKKFVHDIGWLREVELE